MLGIVRIASTLALAAAILVGACFPSLAQKAADRPELQGDPIILGGIWAQSGRAARTMRMIVHGAECGVRFVNEHGGVGGRPLALRVYDSKSSVEGAEAATQAAVMDNAALLLGAGWSSYTLPAARVAQAYGVPFLISIATNPDITLIGNYIFRICFSDNLQGRVLAKFAREELGAKRAALLWDSGSTYSEHLARSFARTFEELGGKVVLNKNYEYSNSDYDPLIEMAKEVDPDILFVPGHDESSVILNRAQDMGVESTFLGGDGWDTLSFMEKGGSSIASAYYTTHWSLEQESPLHMKFLEYCEMPQTGAALAFDAVLLAADAIQRSDPNDPEALRDALAATRDFRGVTGLMDMTQWGDAIKPVVLKRIQHGESRYVRSYKP